MKVASNVDESSGAGKAMHAVLNTSELLEMILSNLQTKDLTRALTVSKRWQKSILSSIVLRRNLFLDPDPTGEYIEYEWKSEYERSVRVTREPCNQRGRPNLAILEPHPFLEVRQDRSGRPMGENLGWLCLHDMPCSSLQSVHPSTFLFQPPLKELVACHIDEFEKQTGPKRMFRITRTEGVTFGDLLDEMQPKDVASSNNEENNKDSIKITASGVLVDAHRVKAARVAQASHGL